MIRLRRKVSAWLSIASALTAGAALVGAFWIPVQGVRSIASADDSKSDDKESAKPGKKAAVKTAAASKTTGTSKETKEAPPAAPIKLPEKIYSTGYAGSYVDLINFVNERIRAGWEENNTAPSDIADDGEWLRRVHLDIVGHVPDLETAEKFFADKDKAKRSKIIEKLLDDPGYVRNFTAIWTNNLIGRGTPRRVSRKGLQKFLRESFGKNRAWSEIVYDLLSAKGHFEENGATNFILSHLNDGAVPATAISAKLFLGIQVQCTQCHNHPFNDWKQDAFWEFNSFFKQAAKVEHEKYNEKTGRMDFDYAELVSRDFEGPVFFERRSGLMVVAYPKFNGTVVKPDGDTDRRLELAKLVITGDKPLLADAMVNRMWGHFFGYGFTKPVDDMGPHNSASNPVLMDRLSTEFVKSGYDLKQLIRWICNSEAYNITSKFTPKKNENDNPAAGETPMFSHLYLKSMSGEQLYDSLIVATNAHKSATASWEQAEAKRQTWMQQFVSTFGTDENDESTTFDGTIPQALMLMNGELIRSAIKAEKGSLLNTVLTDKGSPKDKVNKLYIATLCRVPSPREFTAANKVLKGASSPLEAYQDLYWALLNSNEFIFNH